MRRYLVATSRGEMAGYADSFAQTLQADKGAEYDRVIEIVNNFDYDSRGD